jgi:transcriptional regulator with XRE-family HTH domain
MRRLMLSMSQEKLAEAVGVSYQQMQKYEKGVNRISSSRLQQLAQVLQVTPPFFFEGLQDSTTEVANPVPDYVNDLLATRDGLELVKAFSQITDRNMRRAIVELVEQIEPE